MITFNENINQTEYIEYIKKIVIENNYVFTYLFENNYIQENEYNFFIDSLQRLFIVFRISCMFWFSVLFFLLCIFAFFAVPLIARKVFLLIMKLNPLRMCNNRNMEQVYSNNDDDDDENHDDENVNNESSDGEYSSSDTDYDKVPYSSHNKRRKSQRINQRQVRRRL
jgi:hypothetical protein